MGKTKEAHGKLWKSILRQTGKSTQKQIGITPFKNLGGIPWKSRKTMSITRKPITYLWERPQKCCGNPLQTLENKYANPSLGNCWGKLWNSDEHPPQFVQNQQWEQQWKSCVNPLKSKYFAQSGSQV